MKKNVFLMKLMDRYSKYLRVENEFLGIKKSFKVSFYSGAQ